MRALSFEENEMVSGGDIIIKETVVNNYSIFSFLFGDNSGNGNGSNDANGNANDNGNGNANGSGNGSGNGNNATFTPQIPGGGSKASGPLPPPLKTGK